MKKTHFKKINKLSAGFTLVETLVAISIFTLSLLALMAVLTQSISNTDYAQRKMIATYLNQEGIEYMRNMRDTFVLYSSDSQTGWTAFNSYLTSGSCQSTGNGCFFNADNVFSIAPPQPMTKIALTSCTSATCPNGTLLYDGVTGKYGYTSGTSSGFVRKIKSQVISANETKITSTVYWTQGSGTYNIVFSESLFNWIE